MSYLDPNNYIDNSKLYPLRHHYTTYACLNTGGVDRCETIDGTDNIWHSSLIPQGGVLKLKVNGKILMSYRADKGKISPDFHKLLWRINSGDKGGINAEVRWLWSAIKYKPATIEIGPFDNGKYIPLDEYLTTGI